MWCLLELPSLHEPCSPWGSAQGGISLWSQPTCPSMAVQGEGHPGCKLGLRAGLPGEMFSKAG